jgi:hypothetical protein
MAGITIKTVIPRFDKELKAAMRGAGTEAANSAAARIKSRGRSMIRGSYSNMGGLANALRVTVLPKDKPATTPALYVAVNTRKDPAKKYSDIFDTEFQDQVKNPITGNLWIPFPEARKLMGRKRIAIGDWKRKLKFVKMGSTVVAMANVGTAISKRKKFRTAKNPRLIRRATRNDTENWIPMWFLKKSVSIRPEWSLATIVRQEWQGRLASDYVAAVQRRMK